MLKRSVAKINFNSLHMLICHVALQFIDLEHNEELHRRQIVFDININLKKMTTECNYKII